MISYINGTVENVSETSVVIETGGIGYNITVSPETAALVKIGNTAKIYTFMSVREDGISLFGFESIQKRDLFLKLISVSGIGPKAAMNITGSMSVAQFITAVASGDTAFLSHAQGIGKKTAQRIILELKDKLSTEDIASSIGAEADDISVEIPSNGKKSEALEALMALGYTRGEAFKAVSAVYDENDSVEDILKKSLRSML
ncbi:MAG: Holliday junction branch migration protein RuvA [Clostridia bacterium]|jgi:Holliday junction DNA helicase RuvA|nr:Holliday junction branch migration protein RuvA [Clostridia bacterium]MCI2000891.1 Holliday junction branch migration protein RuvA [Clostridia bacterium]MCI2015675.1 Holliday junction branch migration protein RuvA [Clostridia bacterium]